MGKTAPLFEIAIPLEAVSGKPPFSIRQRASTCLYDSSLSERARALLEKTNTTTQVVFPNAAIKCGFRNIGNRGENGGRKTYQEDWISSVFFERPRISATVMIYCRGKTQKKDWYPNTVKWKLQEWTDLVRVLDMYTKAQFFKNSTFSFNYLILQIDVWFI